MICLDSDHTKEKCALYLSASNSRKEKPSLERGLETSHLVGGGRSRARRPASRGTSHSTDIQPASIGTCVHGVEVTKRSTSARSSGRRTTGCGRTSPRILLGVLNSLLHALEVAVRQSGSRDSMSCSVVYCCSGNHLSC